VGAEDGATLIEGEEVGEDVAPLPLLFEDFEFLDFELLDFLLLDFLDLTDLGALVFAFDFSDLFFLSFDLSDLSDLSDLFFLEAFKIRWSIGRSLSVLPLSTRLWDTPSRNSRGFVAASAAPRISAIHRPRARRFAMFVFVFFVMKVS